MKILMVHNYYRHPGGEDEVFQHERRLLQSGGHEVLEFTRHNGEIIEGGILGKVGLGLRTLWAWDTEQELRTILQRERPDVVHFHNTFPLISPAAYSPCYEIGVPVIQTLHNYRLLCPAATLFRSGRPCTDCIDHSLWRGLTCACYRSSRPATATAALMLALHRHLKTWTTMVDRFIVPSDFVRRQFLKAGFPFERISVKHHCVPQDPGARIEVGEYALFVGRLSPEKGVRTLLSAARLWGDSIPLRIVGNGPLRPELETQRNEEHLSSVSFDGWLAQEQVRAMMKRARFLIVPSLWFEPFGMTSIEAFACGVPVIASLSGAMTEVIEDGQTGLHFSPGDAKDLASKVEWAWTHRKEVEAMGRAARAEYEAKYTAEHNYRLLMEIYNQARARTARKAA